MISATFAVSPPAAEALEAVGPAADWEVVESSVADVEVLASTTTLRASARWSPADIMEVMVGVADSEVMRPEWAFDSDGRLDPGIGSDPPADSEPMSDNDV